MNIFLSVLFSVLEHAFATVCGEVSAVGVLASINTPVARMRLFGIVTMAAMLMTKLIGEHFPDGAWRTLVSEGRMEKATLLERERRGQHSSLLGCLQLSDKGQIMTERPEMLRAFGFPFKRVAKRIIKEVESLRNNLAHSQDIVTHGWASIVRIASRVEEAVD